MEPTPIRSGTIIFVGKTPYLVKDVSVVAEKGEQTYIKLYVVEGDE